MLWSMWHNTRMIMSVAVTAALYAAVLIPFKALPLIPGVTELRPANALPVVCSMLFGPAAAWGTAIGNLVGDLMGGGIGPGLLVGLVSNFFYGLVPYRAWRALSSQPGPAGPWSWAAFLGVSALAAGACALVLGWGCNLLGLIPFAVIANLVLFNNFLTSAVLAPLLLKAVQPRVLQARMSYTQVMVEPGGRSPVLRVLGLVLLGLGVVGGLVAGNLLGTGQLELPGIAADTSGIRSMQVGLGCGPFVALMLLGLALL